MKDDGKNNRRENKVAGGSSKFLAPEQVAMIDEALRSLGEYGEVRLTVQKGRLRFLMTQRSFDALKWEAGKLELQKVDVNTVNHDG